MSWAAATDNVAVAGYYLYDGVSGDLLADSATSPVNLSGLTAGSHSVYAKAYDAAGNVSWRSGTILFSVADPTSDTQRPSTPGGLAVLALGIDSIDLAWDAATDNVAVVGYQVFDNDSGLILADVPASTHSLTGLAAGTYNVYVKAYDAAGNISWRSNIVTATVI